MSEDIDPVFPRWWWGIGMAAACWALIGLHERRHYDRGIEDGLHQGKAVEIYRVGDEGNLVAKDSSGALDIYLPDEERPGVYLKIGYVQDKRLDDIGAREKENMVDLRFELSEIKKKTLADYMEKYNVGDRMEDE